MENITFSEFSKIEIRVGFVEDASNIEKSDKLIRLDVSFGEQGKRIILTGMRKWYSPEYFIQKKFLFAYNLEPKKMLGMESQGMLMSTDSKETPFPVEAPEGSESGDIVL